MGRPNRYNLQLTFVEDGSREISDRQSTRFGIRVVTQHRDQDEQFPDLGKGGNFYLQVNGKDFLVAGRGVHARPALSRRSQARRGDPSLCQGYGTEHAALGIQDLQRAYGGSRRRGGDSHNGRMDVLQSMGEMGPMGCGGSTRGARQPSFPSRHASFPRRRVRLGQWQRWPSARAGAARLSPHPGRSALAERDGGYSLLLRQGQRGKPLVERHHHGGALQLAAAILLVQRALSAHPRIVRGAGR